MGELVWEVFVMWAALAGVGRVVVGDEDGAVGDADVRRVRGRGLGRAVAIKVLPKALSRDREGLARFDLSNAACFRRSMPLPPP